ncbi:M24 family metallopeptidase [Nannocystis pusilla]|uniref:M24 family metallopeptidase n=1 Tax=Nannocystis pusilla TaxID=889268 RepID=UPI003B7C77B5
MSRTSRVHGLSDLSLRRNRARGRLSIAPRRRRSPSCDRVARARPPTPPRAAVAAAGYAADYGNFTHRLGHGIGLQTHEDPYLVRGNQDLLRPGMTMSDEPGVYLIGELGVRLEDIVAITEGEPEIFGPRAGSIDAPFG